MSFAEIEIDEAGQRNATKFKKRVFKYLNEGVHKFLIIQEEPDKEYVHFLNGKYVACLGLDGCPLCTRNRKIYNEDPEDYRTKKGYVPRTQRFGFNILDMTKIKKCPECSSENLPNDKGRYDASCISCKATIAGVEPEVSNSVKIINGGVELISPFKTLATRLQRKDEKLTDHVLELEVEMVSGRRKYALYPSEDPVPTVEDSELFETNAISLNVEEMESVMRGVSYRDIFAARAAERSPKDKPSDEVSKLSSEVAVDVGELIGDLFGEESYDL